jgi:hypothetical protein
VRTPAIFAALDRAESVLIAGAGGGFDVFAGLPLALALLLDQKRVHLANLSRWSGCRPGFRGPSHTDGSR